MSKKTFEFSQKLMLKDGALIHETINEIGFIQKWFNWIIDSKFRKAVRLSDWLLEQVDDAMNKNEWQNYATMFKGSSDDITMINILRHINQGIVYTSDEEGWDMNEKWQTYIETYDRATGDCEDGAVLIYVLARLCDVSTSKLFIACGDTPVGGHAYCIYRADYDGVERTIDWCYWYDGKHIKTREFYTENKSYINEWFRFNESGIFKRRLKHE